MKRYSIWTILAVIIIFIIVFFIFKNFTTNNSNNQIDYSSSRILANIENKNEILDNSFQNKQIASYSTVIKDTSEGRLTNINITCSILNNIKIKPGETFSFNETVR